MTPPLPIDSAIPALLAALVDSTRVVLQAPPGAGKTTRVPLALLGACWRSDRKIVLLEPRRLAARAAARRMASTLGEPVGETVGFRVRGETRVSKRTRIEVVTEGVLARMLISDPGIDDIGAVILDEFHERNLQADLALALALQTQEVLREDLRILVMSATLDGALLRDFLDARLVTSEGRAFPVEMRYLPRRDDIRVEDFVARTVLSSLARDHGSVLAFLPGAGEIHRSLAALEGSPLPANTRIIPLFGALSAADQDEAIAPPSARHRKVVLATSIAESSLTIDGVTVVIDGGLSRVPRFSPRTGMSMLATVRVSRASADQRAGRAGRTAPGVCYRLWDQHEDLQLLDRARPEILEADLASLALDLAAAGVTNPHDLRWIDPPPAAALSQARALLLQLGALDAEHRITAHGRTLASVGLHPRLAHMLSVAARESLGATACALAALIGERDVLRRGSAQPDADLRTRVALLSDERGSTAGALHAGVDRDALRRVREEMNRLRDALRVDRGERVDDTRTGEVLALAYPDRVARRRDGTAHTYLLRNGTGAALTEPGSLANVEFLVVADVDGRAGHSRIYLAAPVSEAYLRERFAADVELANLLEWDEASGTIKAMRRVSLGAMVLSESVVRHADEEAAADLLVDALRRNAGLSLPWNDTASALRDRIAFVGAHRADWPDVSNVALLEHADTVLRPHLVGMRKRSDFDRLPLSEIILGQLTWAQRQQLDELAPSHWLAPTGTNARIDYSQAGVPSVRIRLQEVFGVSRTPEVCGVPLTFELLSPAQRPVQVTRDLAGFWRSSYFAVRKDLRGRYPRHHWPEDPMEAEPTRRAKPRGS